jgi:membrane protein implicated in regulation of membrane protease activity
MPDQKSVTRPPIITPPRIIAGLCLLLPVVALLWVGSYSRVTPKFIGIPFFYWYQMLWVPLSAALTYTAYLLVRREERARKGSVVR